MYDAQTLSVAALTLLSCVVCAAAQPRSPSADEILSKLKPGHPRLMLEAGAIDRLRKLIETDETARRWYGSIRRRADGMLDAPVSEHVLPDGIRLLSTSRRVVDRAYTLGLVWLIEGEAKHADRLWAELEAAASFPDWNPSHFLDTGEMTHAFAIGYDWLHGHWSERQRRVLREAIVRHGLEPALKAYRGEARYGWWTRATHNWNQVCNGGILLGALAIGDEAPEPAGMAMEHAIRLLPNAMQHYAPDGAWNEGPGYWAYATEYTVYALAGMQTALGTDFGLSGMEGFSQAGAMPILSLGPSGITFSFADCRPGRVRSEALMWLARRFDEPTWGAYQVAYARPTALDLLWYEPRFSEADWRTLPRVKHFRGVDFVVARSSWADDALFLAIKGGDNKANHSHLDLGAFVLDAHGKRYFVDFGRDNYNLPGYFGGQRFEYYRLRTESHNILLINPSRQANQDRRAVAPMTVKRGDGGTATARIDLTEAYRPRGAERVVRTAAFDGESVTLTDGVELTDPGEVWWAAHTPAEVSLSDDGRTAALSLDGDVVEVRLVKPEGARFFVMPAAPLPQSPKPERQAEHDDYRKLAIWIQGDRVVRFVVEIEPR